MSDAPRSTAFRIHDLIASFTIHRGMTRDMSIVLSPSHNKAVSALGFVLGGLSVKDVNLTLSSNDSSDSLPNLLEQPFTIIPKNDGEYLTILLRESLLASCSRALISSRNAAVRRLGEELLNMHEDLAYDDDDTDDAEVDNEELV